MNDRLRDVKGVRLDVGERDRKEDLDGSGWER